MSIDTKPMTDAYKTYALHKLIAESHAKKRAELLRQADFERDMAEADYNRALETFASALAAVAPQIGAVPVIVDLSFEQCILALPDDELLVIQRAGSRWTEKVYGKPVESAEDALAQMKRRNQVPADATFDQLDDDLQAKAREWAEPRMGLRFAEDGSQLRYRKVNVAMLGEGLPPEVKSEE